MAIKVKAHERGLWRILNQVLLRVLVATDIAARGLDIEQLPYVVNYELPNVAEDYVHRVGRTGRAAAIGLAVSRVAIDEQSLLTAIERLLKQSIPRMALVGYEPDPTVKPEPMPLKKTANKQHRRKSVAKASHANDKL